jgi:hypothetical protein
VFGPCATVSQYRTVLEYEESGLAEGARITTGGHAASLGGGLEGGKFVEPTVFADVTPEMRISREEIFGPILCILRYDDLDETVSLANNTEFGLRSGGRAGRGRCSERGRPNGHGLRGHQLLRVQPCSPLWRPAQFRPWHRVWG